MIRVLVAEDQSAVRAGLVLILRSAPDIEVVGEAADGEQAVALAQLDSCLTVSVTSPFGDRDRPGAPGSGAGLVGMRERVALLGGAFEAGPVEDPDSLDGKIWVVRATLPVTEGDSR